METYLHIDRVNDYIKEVSKNKGKIFVLEAGCGSGSRFDFGEQYYITGIDISSDQLKKNKILHKKILGDIQTANLEPSSFDMIVCMDVLEHLPNPEKALKNFSQSVKDGGIIIIGVPNVMSLKGLITKFTPYSSHCWVYKYIFRYKGLPYCTYHKSVITPKALITFAQDNNLSILWFHLNDIWLKMLRDKNLPIYTIYFVLGVIVKILTLGKVSITKTECIVVYRKVGKEETDTFSLDAMPGGTKG